MQNGKGFKAWTDHVPFDEQAKLQIKNIAGMPFVFRHVAVMPDVHLGMGATIGSVIATRGAIIPAAVGLDIGCGMIAVNTGIDGNAIKNFHDVRTWIEQDIPHGRTGNGDPYIDDGAYPLAEFSPGLLWWNNVAKERFSYLTERHPEIARCNNVNHLGTLGTGNHFIEVCIDEANRVWVMIHSGSRGFGAKVGAHFTRLAKECMARWFIDLPDKDLSYIIEGTPVFDDYIMAVGLCQEFAKQNRELMMRVALRAVYENVCSSFRCEDDIETVVDCHHNYMAKENHFGSNVWVTRKGAVRARVGDMGIIPGSMGAKSYIVRGKGNPDSFNSCSHGAGRVMSRTEAKKTITKEMHEAAVKGVDCRLDDDVIDESPAAYKNIDAVMESQKDLVEVVHVLKQVVCVKG